MTLTSNSFRPNADAQQFLILKSTSKRRKTKINHKAWRKAKATRCLHSGNHALFTEFPHTCRNNLTPFSVPLLNARNNDIFFSKSCSSVVIVCDMLNSQSVKYHSCWKKQPLCLLNSPFLFLFLLHTRASNGFALCHSAGFYCFAATRADGFDFNIFSWLYLAFMQRTCFSA